MEEVNQNQTTQEQVQAQQSQSKPPFSKFILILIIVLLLGTLGGTYYFFFQKPKMCPKILMECSDGSFTTPDKNCKLNCPGLKRKESTTTSTSNWKTYTNTTYGYEIKYPPNAKQSQFSLDSQFWLDLSESYVTASQGKERKQNFSVSIVEVPNLSKKDFPEFFKEYAATQTKYENLTYSLESAVKNYSAFRNNSLIIPSGDKILQVFVQSPDRARYIVFSLMPYDSQKPFENQESALAIFNQILSTFKFTDQNQITNNPNLKTYTSPLGVSFTYLKTEHDDIFTVNESGNKICITYDPTDKGCSKGQYVEVFDKSSSDSLENAITKRFLANYSPTDCFVIKSTSSKDYSSNFELAEISYPAPTDQNAPFWQNSEKCPLIYSKSNGLSYFLMDKNHSNKFVFFSIGQYPISAGDNKMWQQTIKFTQ